MNAILKIHPHPLQLKNVGSLDEFWTHYVQDDAVASIPIGLVCVGRDTGAYTTLHFLATPPSLPKLAEDLWIQSIREAEF